MFCNVFSSCAFFISLFLGTELKYLKEASSPPSLSVSCFSYLPKLLCWVQLMAGHCVMLAVTLSQKPGRIHHIHQQPGLSRRLKFCLAIIFYFWEIFAESFGERLSLVWAECGFGWIKLKCSFLLLFYSEQVFFKSLIARRMWWGE